MFEVRIHGRGGQGVVTAAEMLSVAAFLQGWYAQAFPSFGSERTGAPVVAFCRLDDKEIRTREPVMRPHALLVQDPSLLHQVDLFSGVGPDAYLLINTTKTLADLGIEDFVRAHRPTHVATVGASDLAMKHVGRPVPNAALLGGFAALTGRVTLDAVVAAIRETFTGRIAEGNVQAARDAHAQVAARATPFEPVVAL